MRLAGRRAARSLTAIAGISATAGLAFLFVSAQYRSEAHLTLYPPHLDHRLPLESRFGHLRGSVLSRETVVLMIQSSSLYLKERERMPVDDVVPLMRADMKLALRTVEGRTQLVVTYSAADPDAVVRGCREIVDRILWEDSRLISSTTQSALRFAEQQLARAEKNAANDPTSRAYLDLAARKVAEARWEVVEVHAKVFPRLGLAESPSTPEVSVARYAAIGLLTAAVAGGILAIAARCG